MVGATADQAMLESAEQSANMFPSRDFLPTCAQLYFSPMHALLAVCSEMRGQRQIVLCCAVLCYAVQTEHMTTDELSLMSFCISPIAPAARRFCTSRRALITPVIRA